jgi:hypothetical protein
MLPLTTVQRAVNHSLLSQLLLTCVASTHAPEYCCFSCHCFQGRRKALHIRCSCSGLLPSVIAARLPSTSVDKLFSLFYFISPFSTTNAHNNSGARAGMRCLQQPLGANCAYSNHVVLSNRLSYVARPGLATWQANPNSSSSSSSSTAAQQQHSQFNRDAWRPNVVCRAGFGFVIKSKAGGKGSKDCPCGSGELYSVSRTRFCTGLALVELELQEAAGGWAR